VTEMLPWDIGSAFRLGVAVADDEGTRVPVVLRDPAGGVARAVEGGSWLRLQAFRWLGSPPRGRVVEIDERTALENPARALFGDRIALTGFELKPVQARPGGELRLRLSWSGTAGPPERDYTVFVHLLDGAGERVAQGDGMPGYLGALPTTLWQPGVPVLDEHILSLPVDLAPGEYHLVVGWYDGTTGERLPLVTGGNSLELTTVLVQE